MSSLNHTDLIHRYLAAYNTFDIEGMLEPLSPEVRFENYSGGELNAAANGIDEFRRLAEQSKSLFSEREQRITALEQGEASVMARIAFRGRLSMDIPDGPRAGTVLELHGTSEFSFNDGRITKVVDRS
jgi:ketosteroid isomerase-like protein